MLRSVAAGLLAGFLCLGGAATAMAAANPSGTGPPSQTCLSTAAPAEPGNGHAVSSPGSPFNETLPGNGGVHYNPNSQYDVACFQVSQH
jgi:hypothetical protein